MRAVDAMSQEEATHAEGVQVAVRQALDNSMRHSERSEYAKRNMIGVSDIGGCREFVRRSFINEPFSDEQEDYAAAFIGTAVGDLAERALVSYLPERPDLRIQMAVTVRLVIRGFELRLPGHPDVVWPNAVWDFKTVDGLGVTRRIGPTDKQWFQVMLYCKALLEAGEMSDPDPWVSVVFIDRSGAEAEPLVFSRQYDEGVVNAAEAWLDDVVYAVQVGEETSRDMPRSWCEACCPRYTACRMPDTDVEGIIENHIVKEAVRTYRAALDAERQAKKDKDSAKSVLANMSGVVYPDGDVPYTLRWVDVPEGDVAASHRSAYRKIDLRPMRLPKVTKQDNTEREG